MITISTQIAGAELEKVWTYWTAPQHIPNWYFASEDWYSPGASSELKTGGAFTISLAARDGSVQFEMSGTYTRVDAPTALAFTLNDGRKVEVTFEQHEDNVRITESFEPESNNPRDVQQAGWQAILDNFRKYVEGHPDQ